MRAIRWDLANRRQNRQMQKTSEDATSSTYGFYMFAEALHVKRRTIPIHAPSSRHQA